MRELALAQVALPLAIALWLVLGRPPTWGDYLFRLMAAWLLLAGIWLEHHVSVRRRLGKARIHNDQFHAALTGTLQSLDWVDANHGESRMSDQRVHAEQ